MEYSNRISLEGTARKFSDQHKPLGPIHRDEKLDVILVLKQANDIDSAVFNRKNLHDGSLELKHKESVHLNDSFIKVRDFAAAHDLEIVDENWMAHTIDVRGKADDLKRAFGVSIQNYDHVQGDFYGHEDEIKIPVALSDIIDGVIGLDNYPLCEFSKPNAIAAKGYLSISPLEMAALYNIPTNFDCSGECIGLLEFSGGYSISDVKAFASDLKIKPPQMADVSVLNAKNNPGSAGSSEVILDIEMAAAVATNCKLAMYFSANTPTGFYAGLRAAVYDKENKPSVVSISWGAIESLWSANAIAQFEKMLEQAKSLSVTVLASTGDKGSSDGKAGTNVQYPSSSALITACGGTEITVENNQIKTEVVWSNMVGSTGGGVSNLFPVPDFQKNANVPPEATTNKVGRGTPDISANAFGIEIIMNGQKNPSGGTSAVAPFIAGLVAILNKKRSQPIGYLNELLAEKKSDTLFRDITQGSNGAYKAGKGWDACTGWGSLDGATFLSTFST